MKYLSSLLCLGLIILFAAGPTLAQEPFNADEINRFMTTLPGFVSLMEKEGQSLDGVKSPGAWEQFKLGLKFKSFLKDQGWPEPQRFIYVASQVSKGLAAGQAGKNSPEVQAQMEAAKQQIMNNPGLSAELKKQMMAQFEQSQAAYQQMQEVGKDIPAQEMSLIKTYQDQLLAIYQNF
ncbi:MAG: YlbF family regulator [Proteobacteria bacterium]|nr:YlbF family regulator [Pseudomonadota bacterium]